MTSVETRAAARAWAEISQSALRGNIQALQAYLSGNGRTRLLAVLKADAYGHGLGLIAPQCFGAGITDFGVATVDEGIALRTLLPAEAVIYLLTAALPADASEIVAHRLTAFVGDLRLAQSLSEAAAKQDVPVDVHLDVDTGIGRAGVQEHDACGLLVLLLALPFVRVTGIATHFAEADEDAEDAHRQNASFQQLLCQLGAKENNLLVHASNSPALLALGTPANYGLVRPGLLLYGIEPAPGMFATGGDQAGSLQSLRPIMSLCARVLLCRYLPGGTTISYGRTYTVPSGGGMYATIGIGYGDGYPRRLGNGVGHVLLAGQAAPICGRVCMDQLVVDVSHIPHIQAGDAATLIGIDGGLQITAGQMAQWIQTTPHEISTCLTARVPRILAA